jgi:hypothetical protein
MATKKKGKPWTPAQRAKFIASMRARREAKAKGLLPNSSTPKGNKGPLDPQRESILYLQHAERDINSRLRAGELKGLGKAELYMLLALKTLRGS